MSRTDDAWWLRHLWVLPPWIGQGIGRTLFAHAAARAEARGATSLTIKSDPSAELFYLHLGANGSGVAIGEVDGTRRES